MKEYWAIMKLDGSWHVYLAEEAGTAKIAFSYKAVFGGDCTGIMIASLWPTPVILVGLN